MFVGFFGFRSLFFLLLDRYFGLLWLDLRNYYRCIGVCILTQTPHFTHIMHWVVSSLVLIVLTLNLSIFTHVLICKLFLLIISWFLTSHILTTTVQMCSWLMGALVNFLLLPLIERASNRLIVLHFLSEVEHGSCFLLWMTTLDLSVL